MKKIILPTIAMLLLSGCANSLGEPKIDFSEDEKLIEKIKNKNSLSDNRENETNSLYSEDSIDLLSDYKVNLKVGDVVFVTINENVSRNSVGRKQTVSNSTMAMTPMNVTTPNKEHKLTSSLIGKLQPLFNLGVESDKSSTFNGTANTVNEETFESSINAIITKQITNDLYYIEAKKSILLNGEKQVIKMTGYVHKNDIDNSYKIDSNKVVELKVSYENEGQSKDATDSSFINNFMNKIFF